MKVILKPSKNAPFFVINFRFDSNILNNGTQSKSERIAVPFASFSTPRELFFSSRHREDPPASSTDDKNGEISLSIEETNKLRISLGLKPLSVGPSKKEQAVVNVQKTSAQLDAEREQQELKKKLQQSKTRRELTQKLAGKSLGEQLQAEVEGRKTGKDKTQEALEWVKQSRKKKVKEQESREKREKYDATALAGMT
ncbi:U4/U6.U5 tri-snRNP-associated protein, partial [Phytophthora palmivora]